MWYKRCAFDSDKSISFLIEETLLLTILISCLELIIFEYGDDILVHLLTKTRGDNTWSIITMLWLGESPELIWRR